MYAEHYGTGAGTERELYDLAADPLQLESFHDQEPVLQASLEARLRELEHCRGEQCR